MSDSNIFTPETGAVFLAHILNPLDVRHRTLHTLSYVPGQTLDAYISDRLEEEEYIASVNGMIIESADFGSVTIRRGDSIVLCPAMLKGKNSGLKKVLRLAAMVAVAWAVGPAASGGLGWGASAASAMGITSGLGVAMVTGGMMMAGSMLVNAVFSPAITPASLAGGLGSGIVAASAVSSTGQVSAPSSSGPGSTASYSYDGPKSTQGEGSPVMVVYGEYAVGGHLIESFIESDSTYQTGYMLYSAGEGPIAGIENVKINGAPVSSFAGTIQTATLLGTADQDALRWFDRQVSSINVSIKLTEQGAYSPIRTTTKIVDKLRFSILFPGGLVGYNRRGDSLQASAAFQFEFRKTGTTNWLTMTRTFTSSARGQVRFQTSTEPLDPGVYEMRVKYLASSVVIIAPPEKTTNARTKTEIPAGGISEVITTTTNIAAGYGINSIRYSDGSVALAPVFDGALWVKKDENGQLTVVDSGLGPGSFSLVRPPKGYTWTPVSGDSVQITFNTDVYNYINSTGITLSPNYLDRDGNQLQTQYYNSVGVLLGPPVIDEGHQITTITTTGTGFWDDPIVEHVTVVNTYKKPDGAVDGNPATPANPTVTVRVGPPIVPDQDSDDGTAQMYDLYDKSTEAYWGDFEEIVTEKIGHIYTALIGLKIDMAAGKINSLPNVTFTHKGKLVRTWNSTTNSVEMLPSNNPAWIALDMLTDNRYGAEMSDESIDLPAFRDWAKFCVDEELTFNGVFDAQQNLWDALQYVLKAGHATILRIGTLYSLTIESASAPVMMFSKANMIEGSYSETWLPTADRANEIELSYFDPLDEYRQRTIKVYDPEIIGSGRPVRNSSAILYGVTDPYRAFLEGVMLLNMNRYILKTCEFDAPIEALACTVGDVVYVSHDSTDWNQGGRIMSGSTHTVLNLDQPVPVDASKSYRVLLHIPAVRRVSGTVTSVIESQNLVQISSSTINGYKRLRIKSKRIDVAAAPSQNFGWISVDSASGIVSGDAVELVDTDVIVERDVINDPSWTPDSTAVTLTLAGPIVLSSEAILTAKTEIENAADDIFEEIEGAHFMFGESTRLKQKYRIRAITGTSDFSRHITAVQYDERVYTLDASLFENIATTSAVTRVYPPTHLKGIETIYNAGDGYKSRLHISWNAPKRTFIDHYEATVTPYGLAGEAATVRVESQYRSVITHVVNDCPPGTWDLEVRSVDVRGNRSEPAKTTITVNGAAPFISSIGLEKPVNPRFKLDMDPITNSVMSITINTGVNVGTGAVIPDTLCLFYSTDKMQNKVKIISGGVGSTLVVGGVDLVQGTLPLTPEQLQAYDIGTGYNYVDARPLILAGSTRSYIKLLPDDTATPFNVEGMRLEGRYWVWWDGVDAMPASTFDSYGIMLDRPAPSAPPAGAQLHWVQAGFHDERAFEMRLGFISNGETYEVLRWSSFHVVDGQFVLTGCERGIEDTTPIYADGHEMHYFPAHGAGTVTELMRVANGDFTLDPADNTRVITTRNLMIPLKDMTWASASCCTAALVDGKIVRSPIVPIALDNS